MRIDEILAPGEPVFSFEFFPPKTEEGEARLYQVLQELRTLEPAFVSVTYGAGGSTRAKTIEIVKRIRDEHGLEAMAHFTCVGATVAQLRATLDEMREAGIENVLALRGDPPAGHEEWVRTEGGLEYSSELVELIRADYRLRDRRGLLSRDPHRCFERRGGPANTSRQKVARAWTSSSRSSSSTTRPTSTSCSRARRRASACPSSPGSCPSPTSGSWSA